MCGFRFYTGLCGQKTPKIRILLASIWDAKRITVRIGRVLVQNW